METKTMKFIDETFGPVLCFFFHWYNFLKKIVFRSPYALKPEGVKNILIIKFFGMGSILLATPMIRALKKSFPNARIILLTFSSNAELASRLKSIDEVIGIPTSSLPVFLINLAGAILRIRKMRCEVSLDLEFFAKSSTLIQYLCARKIRVGYYLIQIGFLLKMMWRGNLLTHNVYYNPHRHVTEAFLALARSIGAVTDNILLERPEIYAQERAGLEAILTTAQIGEKDFLIAMNINSGRLCLERRWPLENFAMLARMIIDNHRSKIILVGDVGEAGYAEEFLRIGKAQKGIVNLTGRLNLGILAALLEKVNLFVTNDSGPLHLAVSLGVPTVSFFGPEIPERFGPLGKGHTVLYSGVYCSPCLNIYNQKTAPCNGNNICMSGITVEEAYKAIKERYLDGL